MSNYQTLEPLGRDDKSVYLSVSLRGSLAGQYRDLLINGDTNTAQEMINRLLVTPHPDVLRAYEDDMVVIGLRSERGRFFPDW